MLDRRVCEAVAEGRFQIHSVATIEQGLEILTGLPAGQRGPDGSFPTAASMHGWKHAWSSCRRR